MNQLVDAALAFPTAILTGILGFALLYWITVILGALDVDVLGDADVDAALEGGAGDADLGDGGDVGDASVGGFSALRRLRQVPLTISISTVVFFAWAINVASTIVIGDLGVVPHTPLVVGGFAVGLLVSVPVSSVAVRPLVPLFVTAEAKYNRDYVGQVCEVVTGRVDADFGTAEFSDGGPVLRIQVRCDQPGRLARGDSALIIDYDEARHAFVIEPLEQVVGPTAGAQPGADEPKQHDA